LERAGTLSAAMNDRPRIVSATGRIAPQSLDPDAVRVVERLQHAGFEAYLVGGCVRDLWLGRKPKDFDVVTSARPRQIRRLFRNCRIIGRRFKLAHVVFGRPDGTEHIVETATFRRAPEPAEEGQDDLLITDDNTFGTAAEDAVRRDFTINALFFDPRSWQIIDFIGGLADLDVQRIETIGNPNIRLREDPVRILRAIKFASRLHFKIAHDTYEAMVRHSGDLAMSAVPRLLEETLRLLRSGHSYTAFQILARCGALSVVLPEIAQFLEVESGRGPQGRFYIDLFWRDLQALDESVAAGDPVTPAFLHSVLFYRLFERELDPARRLSPFPIREPLDAAEAVLDPYGRRMRIAKFDIGRAKQICASQPRFALHANRKFRPGHFVEQDYFPEALAMLRIHCVALDALNMSAKPWETYDAWYQLFRRHHARDFGTGVGEVRFPSRTAAPAAEPTFQELWNLPTRGDQRRDQPAPRGAESSAPSQGRTDAPRREVSPPAPSKEEALQQFVAEEPPPSPVPAEPLSASTIRIAATLARRAALRAASPDAAGDPASRPIPVAGAQREPIRYRVTRPDAKFEFPENPIVTIEDGPQFGDW
jgi:poly(A) polymerase